MVWWFFSLCFSVIFLYFWSCKANQLWRRKIINVVKKLSMCISKYWHHLTVVVVLRSPSLYSFTTTSFSSSTLIYSPKAKPVLQMVPVEWCSLVIVSLVWLVGWFALRRGRDGWLRWIEFVRDKEEFVEVSLKASKNLFSTSRWVLPIPPLFSNFSFCLRLQTFLFLEKKLKRIQWCTEHITLSQCTQTHFLPRYTH